MRIAHDIEVNAETGRIVMDGLTFPYHVGAEPEVELMGPGGPAILTIAIPTRNLVYVSTEGERRVLAAATDAEEMAWARQRAKEIVLEGLADIVSQLKVEEDLVKLVRTVKEA